MSKLAPVFKIQNKRVVDREGELLRLCAGKKVLHLGCADVPYTLDRGDDLLHRRLSTVTDELWGLDPSEEGCDLLREMGFPRIIAGSLEDQADTMRNEKFDVILAGEVIEHVDNAGLFLQEIKSVMNGAAELVITTVNAPSLMSISYAFLSREKVHPDHNYYFSQRTLTTLVEKQGLTPVDLCYYRVMNSSIDRMLSPFKHLWPATCDGLILRAKRPPMTAPG